MARENLELERVSKRLGLDPDKLDAYMLYLNDEVLFEPDFENPHAPCLTTEQRDMYTKYSLRIWASVYGSSGLVDS